MKKPEPSDYGLTQNEINKFINNKFDSNIGKIAAVGVIMTLGAFWLFFASGNFLFFVATILLFLSFYGIISILRSLYHNSYKYKKFLGYTNSMKNYDMYIEGEKQRIRNEIQEEEERRAKIIKQKKEFWQGLTGKAFEKEMAILFKNNGFEVILTPAVADGGIDIILRKNKKRIIVQCKAHKNPVAIATAREVYGALLHSKANEAFLVSISGFTSGVKKFVKNKPIKLMDLDDILKNKLP